VQPDRQKEGALSDGLREPLKSKYSPFPGSGKEEGAQICKKIIVSLLTLSLILAASSCVTVYPPETNNQTTTTQPTTPSITTQSFILGEGHNRNSIPIYLRTGQTLHMVCTFTNQVGLVWISVVAPNDESYGVTASGFVQGANICEALVDRVIITFSPRVGFKPTTFGLLTRHTC
jgi:hypothetical protein